MLPTAMHYWNCDLGKKQNIHMQSICVGVALFILHLHEARL